MKNWEFFFKKKKFLRCSEGSFSCFYVFCCFWVGLWIMGINGVVD